MISVGAVVRLDTVRDVIRRRWGRPPGVVSSLARLGYFGKLAKEYRSARPASTAVVRYLFL